MSRYESMAKGASTNSEIKNDVKKMTHAFKAISKFSGLYGWVYFLIVLIGTLTMGGIFGYTLYTEVRLLDRDFRQSGRAIALSLGENSKISIETKKYAPLILIFDHLLEEQKQNDSIPLIEEVFLLSRKGVVLAHPDPTLVTVHAKSIVSKISGHYNNEFFHNSVMLSPGDVYVQPYPSEKYDRGGKILHLLKAVLPEFYFRAVDFSTPIHIKRKAEGSLHVVMSRRNIDKFLFEKLEAFGIAWLGLISGAALFLVFIRIPIQKKWKQIQGLLIILKAETDQVRFQEEMLYIDKRIEELKVAAIAPNESKSEGTEPSKRSGDILEPIDFDNVQDAILIEEN
ncbi:MAG: hypothetical protein ABUK01_01350 [Leptospirales bacterium]